MARHVLWRYPASTRTWTCCRALPAHSPARPTKVRQSYSK